MAQTAMSVRAAPPHATLCQLVEAVANELNLEKTQFWIEEILKDENDAPLLAHDLMNEGGSETKITTPSNPVSFANTKWFRVSLKTEEDLIPPYSRPPIWVYPPVTG